jgi:hypothetical protein
MARFSCVSENPEVLNLQQPGKIVVKDVVLPGC